MVGGRKSSPVRERVAVRKRRRALSRVAANDHSMEPATSGQFGSDHGMWEWINVCVPLAQKEAHAPHLAERVRVRARNSQGIPRSADAAGARGGKQRLGIVRLTELTGSDGTCTGCIHEKGPV